MSGEPLANVFGGFEDQVVVAGDVRHVAFSVGEGTFGNGPAFVRIDVASQGAAASRLYGDYNEDLRVDGGDFLVWQRQFGTQGTSSADGNGNGVVDAADYTVWRDNFGASGARFDPSVATLRNSQGEAQTPIQFAADTPLGSMSFGVFQIAAGDYSVDVGGAGTGAFELRMTLIGDLDGDHDVDLADLNAIRGLTQTGGYSPSADVNLDGVITSFDYSYARRNNENSLALTAIPQLTLGESNSFASRYSQLIDLRPVEGTRTITIDIDASFDRSASSVQGDLFQVYLLDPSTGEALLAGSADGSALFTLAENGHELAAGRVTYGGGRITVDLSGIAGAAEGELVLQLLSGDTDQGSQVSILNIANEVGEATASLAILTLPGPVFTAGPALDLQSLTSSNELQALISNVRFDPSEGIYRAQLRVKNNGPSTGRNIAVVLPGFAASVQGGNASGISPAGAPYWNLRSAIPSGGLQAGALSGAVEIEIRDPAALRLILTPQILVGEPNRAPQFAALPSLTLHPGEVLEKVFAATDQDGDTLTYSISTPEGLPPSEFSSIGRLTLKPGVGDLGTYHTTITVTDGVLSTSQQLAIVVEADPVTTTRISGFVLGTNGQPLEGIPVEIAGFSSRTAADGSFTITLPTMQTPTEAFNISVPAGDLFLDPFNTGTQEIPLRRARFDVTTGDSALNPRQNPNLVTSFIDASVVYGSDETRAAALRTFSDGKLKTSAGNLLPVNNAETFPDGLLENDNEGRSNPTTLFSTGDVRTNENVALIAIHTVLMREHNRLADQIQAANPALSDEAIYQQARRMVGAIIQNITYNEYLPLLLGTGVLAPYAGYNSTVDPSESALFAAAAFRLGHTQLSPEIERLDASGQSLPGGPLALSNAFFTVDPINTDGIEPYLRGLAVTPMQEMDTKIIDAVRNFLFGPPGAGGMDLASLNIQRGRDVGLASYTQARLDFGLPAITSFAQITSNTVLQSALAGIYGTVDKVDVWVGGLAENRAAGALVGPLFQAILKDQFQRSRDGDRFWFENGQFTTSELSTIRSTNLEQLIERNAPGVDLPAHPFTTSSQPSAPAPAGTAAATAGTEFRTYDGSGNNLADPNLGANGSNVLRNFTNGYGDGISTPGGADRPGAREISNAVNAQSGSIANTSGITSLLTFWGQILDHDLGLTPGGVSSTLRIQGNLRPVGQDGAAHPFVAEKMELMLGHAVYPGVNNVISRPIYLPAIDVANGVTVNPAQDTVVTTAAIPGASIVVKAGTLQDRQGHLFAGSLSITEVPRDLTPAALPANLLPDLVVTIQPADMILTQPAPLSLPNRAGWAAGTKMDLWSINPITGFFDIVGQGQVSTDGSIVETISGGIRNSSWHLFSPTAEDLEDESKDNLCGDEATAPAASEVELLSGALLESHNLVPYESLGSVRGLTLSYDSKRANPRAELSFSMAIGNSINAGNQGIAASSLTLLGRATIDVGGTILQSTSTNGAGSNQIWAIDQLGLDDVGSRINAGFAFGLNSVPTGVYSYSIKAGGVLGAGSGMAGTLSEVKGNIVTVNGMSSAFGAGWGLAGLTEVFETKDGSLLLVDGDGSESVFGAPTSPGGAYINPMGHFGSLVKQADGMFVHTMTDKTVYRYNAANKLASIRDRNGNETRFEYSGDKLMRIVDSAGLATTFQYSGAMVSSITDPVGRVTTLTYDGSGNLKSIADPDAAVRAWQYDASHLMTGETTERGFQETTLYNSAGMVSGVVRGDETTVSIVPAAAVGLATTESSIAVKRTNLDPIKAATRTDGNGQIIRYVVDRAGQFISASDGAGSLGAVSRDEHNLITSWRSGRANPSTLAYDALGNVVASSETLTTTTTDDGVSGGPLFPGTQFSLQGATKPTSVAIGDVNGDGRLDLVTANNGSNSISVLLGDGVGGFADAVNYTVGLQPSSVAIGDVNGDGRLDLVTANNGSNSVSVLLGDGVGGFANAVNYTVGLQPSSLALGDVNGDGRLDVVTANYGSNNVSILLGDGVGGFAMGINYAVGLQPSSVALGDVNGDGRLDVFTGNYGSRNASVLLGDGTGGFAAGVNYDAGLAVSSLALGDLNSDGRLDLVAGSEESGSVSILLGESTGGFAPRRSVGSGSRPGSIALGDVNGDGRLDIVATNDTNVGVLVGDGGGGFTAPRFYAAGLLPDALALGDVNGDGALDIVTAHSRSNHVSILFADGTDGFAASVSIEVGANPKSGVLGDLNGDGWLDFVTANDTSNNVSVLLGDGIGGFSSPQYYVVGSTPVSAALADVNGDGNLDIVTANSESNNISILFGDGAGGFASAVNHTVGLQPRSVAIGDVNGDGRLDVVAAGLSFSVLLGDGTGGFATAVSYFATTTFNTVALSDVNGDSRLDVVGTPFYGDVVYMLLGNGAGGFADAVNVAVGEIVSSVALGDVNDDGKIDLVAASDFSGKISVLLGNGAGGFAAAMKHNILFATRSVTLGDINDDGKLDVIAANYQQHIIVVLLGNGVGGFAAPQFSFGEDSAGLSEPVSVALGDVNDDGMIDLVTANEGSNNVSVWLSDGTGQMTVMATFGIGASLNHMAFADLNGDGKLDLVTANEGSNNVGVMLRDGIGGFANADFYAVESGPNSVALGDVDSDGKLDVIVTRGSSNSISVLLADGAGGFDGGVNHAVGLGPSSVALGDINGDGNLDLVTANKSSNDVSILLGDGAGGFASAVNYVVGSSPILAAFWDTNGDGRLDIVTANSDSNSISVLLGDGTGGFAAAVNYAVGSSLRSVAFGDVNGDGKLDLVAAIYGSQNVSVLLGDGVGGFSAPELYFVGSYPLSVAIVDLNGDGKFDIVTGDDGFDSISVLFNVSRDTVSFATTSSTYDPTFSQPTSRTDERGNVTNFTIDPANGNITASMSPEGQRMVYTYTASGLIDTMTDSLGRITDYDYNAIGRLTTVTYAKGTLDQGIVYYEYDLAGNQTAMIDENNHRSEYEYDARNRLTVVRDALGHETKYDYDKAGNVTKITDPLGHVTTNDYDARNRLVRTTDFQGNVTQFGYDAEGNVIRVTDPLGHITKHRYDARHRRIETIDPDGGKTLFRYDADNNLTALIDPEGNRTLFFYDSRNRLTKETDPLGKSITYKYDAADNLIEKKDRNGRVTKYAYDGLNRLKTETWVGDGNVLTYSYDTESNLLDVADDFSRLSYEYDARYRVTSVDNHGSQAGGTPQAPRVVVNYAYDAASNVLSVIDTINGSAGATTGYDYDALDRLTMLTQTGAGLSDKRVDFGYNDLSQTTSIERYRNLAGTQKVVGTSFVYDTLNRLESISHDNAVGSPVAFYDYVYDDASRITRITDVDGVTNYGYDSRDQLTSANHSAPGQADESYDYDANGNRESSHLHGTGYVVGPGNRLLSDGTYNYAYDDEGNTVKRTEITTNNYREFTWDHRNRLTKVVDKLVTGTPTQVVEFTYDAFDRRISKSVDTTPLDAIDAAIMSFVYDREDVILDFVDADGAGASPAQLDQRYLHGPAIDQVLAQDDGAGTTHWMLTDHLGSIRDLVTQNGAVAERVEFDSFGNTIGATLSRYQFTGREFDTETELSYYRSRYLDSNTGSFLSQDSLRFGAGDSNLSRYVGNSAPNHTDPSGNNPILVGIGLGLLLDWFSRPNIANAPAPETNTLPGYSDLDYLRQDAFGAMCSLGIGAAAKPLAKGLSSLAGRSNQSSLPNNLFHYTDEATAGLIERSQLGLPGRTTYLTPNGQLSPVQAQIELALPQTNTAGAIFEINTLGLDASKVLLQQRVPGNVFNRGGGGVEILYNGTIPLESVRRVR